MKKIITIAIIIIAALGVGWYLFKISPTDNPQGQGNSLYQLDPNVGQNIQNLSEPLPVSAADFVLGNKDAKNTFIAYEDFECPACANFESVLAQIPTTLKDTKVVFRIFPLVQIHQSAVVSSYAAMAAANQGKFWEFSQTLFAKQVEWQSLSDPLPQFATYAQSVGIPNLDQFQNDITSQKFKSELGNSLREALGLNLQGTPSIFFNGKELQIGDINSIKSQAEKLYR